MTTTRLMFDKLIQKLQGCSYYLPRVNLIPEVGTHIYFSAKGGLICGVPFLTVSDSDEYVTLWSRKLFKKSEIGSWPARNEEERDIAIEEILQHLSDWPNKVAKIHK